MWALIVDVFIIKLLLLLNFYVSGFGYFIDSENNVIGSVGKVRGIPEVLSLM